mgnify:FL=1
MLVFYLFLFLSNFSLLNKKYEKEENLCNLIEKDKYMYALVEILGKQYKAEEGKVLLVDRIPQEAGSSYEISKVLAVVDGEKAVFGTPCVENAKVLATVGEEVKGDKVKVYKFRRRKGYRRTQGHREKYTQITINKIEC